MKKIYILIVAMLLIMFSGKVYSQEERTTMYKSKFILKASGGLNVPLTNINQNRETDNLIENSTKSQIAPSLSLTWFVKERFGVEFNLKFSYFNERNEAENNFKTFAANEYGENYYVNARTWSFFTHEPVVSFGLVYRKETESMYFHPKLAFGITTVDFIPGEITLKEKNTNFAYRINYSGGAYEQFFTIIPSISIGYKLSKRFWADLSINASYFRANFDYWKTTTNLYTQEQEVEQIPYRKNVFDTYISLGVNYVLFHKKR